MFSFVAAALATLNHAVMHGMKLQEAIIAFLSIFALSAGLMFVFAIILLRRTRSTRLLEEAFLTALNQAFDRSLHNPHSANKQHEQHTSQASTKP
jgi:hypothetical protein